VYKTTEKVKAGKLVYLLILLLPQTKEAFIYSKQVAINNKEAFSQFYTS